MNANLSRNEKISRTLRRTDFAVGTPSGDDNIVHRSDNRFEDGVIAKIHAICESYAAKGKTRKQILERCAKLGIAAHTARTQYERWRDPEGYANYLARQKAKRAAAKKVK